LVKPKEILNHFTSSFTGCAAKASDHFQREVLSNAKHLFEGYEEFLAGQNHLGKNMAKCVKNPEMEHMNELLGNMEIAKKLLTGQMQRPDSFLEKFQEDSKKTLEFVAKKEGLEIAKIEPFEMENSTDFWNLFKMTTKFVRNPFVFWHEKAEESREDFRLLKTFTLDTSIFEHAINGGGKNKRNICLKKQAIKLFKKINKIKFQPICRSKRYFIKLKVNLKYL
jgi:hypothetical protein